MKSRIKNFTYLFFIVWNASCPGFSGTYFYELYIHNEYYAEPPGFPNKLTGFPIIASFSGKGKQWKEKRLSAGLVESLRLTHNHTWIEFIAGFGKERVRFNNQGIMGEKSRFGMDDFLIDIGHNFLDATGKKQLLLHWLTGIPITRKVNLIEINEPLWGTRTFATGPVIECIYDFVRNNANDIFVGFITRFLHRFKRRYEPILPSNAFFHPGNSLDILALFHYRYYGHNIEVGYVYTLNNKIAYQFADHIQRLPSERYNSFYGEYFYFYEKLSLGLEIGFVKTFGKPFEGITIFGELDWYF